MIEFERFEMIRRKHGRYCSWAIWADTSKTPKSNIEDMSVFNSNLNPTLLHSLNPRVVMVGLNISRPFAEDFRNFHDASPFANDFKIRYAFKDTKFYGAYMTDIIKDELEVKSSKMMNKLKLTPLLIENNVHAFCEELNDLGSDAPLLLAFGVQAHRLILKYVPRHAYAGLVKLTHYSHQIGKEKYREQVMSQIKNVLKDT